MRIADDVAALRLSVSLPGGTDLYHPALILDPVHGPTLVDAGTPGQLMQLQTLLEAEGVKLADLRRVLVTHHDIDHVGSLPEVVEATGAEVLAAPEEVPYIQDGRRIQKFPPLEMVPAFLERFPEDRREMMRAVLTREPGRVPVSRTLRDGERLDLAGGVRVIFTPGHTVGHTSFYLERSGILIAGDALTAQGGELRGPSPNSTHDLTTAHASVKRLAEFAPNAILCYHGGLISEDASGQMRRLAQTLA